MESLGGLSPRPKESKLTAVAPLLGLLAVLAGCLLAWNASENESYGWFAYAPLSNQSFAENGLVFIGPWTWVGLGIAAAGLLLLAFAAGYRIGRQHRDARP